MLSGVEHENKNFYNLRARTDVGVLSFFFFFFFFFFFLFVCLFVVVVFFFFFFLFVCFFVLSQLVVITKMI